MISIFARYVDTQRFPTSAYFNISLIYLLSLSSLGLLGLDLAYTLYGRESQEEQPHSQAVSILWNVVYWGSMVTGSVFGTFLTRYWQSGHFTMSRRISHTLKVRNYVLLKPFFQGLAKLIIVGGVIFGILAGIVYSLKLNS